MPIFKTMFEGLGSSLPAPTQMLVTISQNMFWIIPTLVVLIVGGAVWWRANKNTDAVRRVVDPLKLKAPVFGKLVQKIAIARFTRNFANMIGARCADPAGAERGRCDLGQLRHRAGHEARRRVGAQRAVDRRSRSPTSRCSRPMVVQMMAVGEDSGSLEIMLIKIADFYDDEVQAMTEALTSLIEPLLIAFLGVVIGGMVVALYMPIFSIATAVNGAK